MLNNKPVIGITIGDINGIGPEIIIKTLSDDRIYNFCVPVVYGSTRVLSHYKKILDNNKFKYSTLKDWKQLNEKQTNIVSIIKDEPEIKEGKADDKSGKYALDAIDAALKDWKEGKIDAIVTAPINKNLVAKVSDKKFTGHTEYITEFTKSKDSMMILHTDSLRVGLVTNHLPVNEVAGKLSLELVAQKIEELNNALVQDFNINKPKIAVLALNPHAGDNGLLGSEELDIIEPAISQCGRKGIIAVGPFSADGLFGSGKYKAFDAVLAMYHDQGLAPFKALTFDEGVNFTAGIPLVRTSPDHGTAYDIAGKNEANETSMRHAIFAAIDAFKYRKDYQELTENKLQKNNVKREKEK